MTGPVGRPTLSLRGLRKTLGGADRRFSIQVDALDLAEGEVAILTGASGSGKSTLLEMIGLASSPDEAAQFSLRGPDGDEDVAALFQRQDRAGLARLRAASLGFVLQTGGLLPFLTVAENVTLAQSIAGHPDKQNSEALLDALGLGDLGNALPQNLSVGQRQRAAVARAMAHRPALLLADEPTASLDPDTKATTAALILSTAAQFGSAVLIATHEHAVFAAGTARILTIRVEAGPQSVAARLEEAA